MRIAFVISALTFISPALGAPTIIPITKGAGPVKAGSFIVKFKDGATNDDHFARLTELLSPSGSSVTYDYRPLMPAFAANLKDAALTLIQRMPEVEYIEQDQIASISEHEAGHRGLEPASPETLASGNPLFGRAKSSGNQGAGVTIYGIDTGIYIGHNDFGGRASFGANFVQNDPAGDGDGNGHGTHTAATAVGEKYGVAKKAGIIAVKVLDSKGSGATSVVIAGVNWACKHFIESGKRPSIATMSLGGIKSSSMDGAVKECISRGVHFTIAAGNSNLLAGGFSPARVEEANTIGAVDSENKKADFSNFGPKLDVWAPGVNITSAWIGSPDAHDTISGTSMATPFVAGILANAISDHDNKTPKELSEDLKSHAKSVVTGAFWSTNKLATGW